MVQTFLFVVKQIFLHTGGNFGKILMTDGISLPFNNYNNYSKTKWYYRTKLTPQIIRSLQIKKPTKPSLTCTYVVSQLPNNGQLDPVDQVWLGWVRLGLNETWERICRGQIIKRRIDEVSNNFIIFIIAQM